MNTGTEKELSVRERFRQSAGELHNLKSLTAIAMLLALRIALGFATTIRITDSIKIGFSIFPTTVLCMLFGPVAGAIAGGVADLVGFFIKPSGVFFPGYTLDCIVAGLIYGYSFYKREKITPLRVVLTLLSVTVIVNLCMTTTWISFQMSVGSFGAILADPAGAFHNFTAKFVALLLGGRLWKNLVMLPINSVLVYLLLNLVRKLNLKRILES
ncbi:MAG: folate family ECF transporter S component [Lachnospiraceae bacterium]